MAKVFSGMGRNELNPVANKVLESLRQQPITEHRVGDLTQAVRMVPEKQLRAMFFHEASTQELDAILRHLDDTGKIERLAPRAVNGSVSKVYIRLVE